MARKQGHPKGSKLDEHEAFLLGLVAANDDVTLADCPLSKNLIFHDDGVGTTSVQKVRGLLFFGNQQLDAH